MNKVTYTSNENQGQYFPAGDFNVTQIDPPVGGHLTFERVTNHE